MSRKEVLEKATAVFDAADSCCEELNKAIEREKASIKIKEDIIEKYKNDVFIGNERVRGLEHTYSRIEESWGKLSQSVFKLEKSGSLSETKLEKISSDMKKIEEVQAMLSDCRQLLCNSGDVEAPRNDVAGVSTKVIINEGDSLEHVDFLGTGDDFVQEIQNDPADEKKRSRQHSDNHLLETGKRQKLADISVPAASSAPKEGGVSRTENRRISLAANMADGETGQKNAETRGSDMSEETDRSGVKPMPGGVATIGATAGVGAIETRTTLATDLGAVPIAVGAIEPTIPTATALGASGVGGLVPAPRGVSPAGATAPLMSSSGAAALERLKVATGERPASSELAVEAAATTQQSKESCANIGGTRTGPVGSIRPRIRLSLSQSVASHDTDAPHTSAFGDGGGSNRNQKGIGSVAGGVSRAGPTLVRGSAGEVSVSPRSGLPTSPALSPTMIPADPLEVGPKSKKNRQGMVAEKTKASGESGKVAEYFASLSEDVCRELNEKAKDLRRDRLSGTDDVSLLRHVNMQPGYDNLYLVCVKLTPEEPETIQLVQADKYDVWWDTDVGKQTNVDDGEWHCTFLQPYWEDVNMPLDKLRWRYQIHLNTSKVPGAVDYSNFYFSYDDAQRRGGHDGVTIEWAQPIDLRPRKVWTDPTHAPDGGKFVYGPFSWKKNYPFRVDANSWLEALPAILKCGTTSGTIFASGFDDRLLERATKKTFLTKELIAAAKEEFPTKNAERVPVLYSSIHAGRRSTIRRIVAHPSKVTKDKTPYLYEADDCDDSTSVATNPTKGAPSSVGKGRRGAAKSKRIGMWMELETANQKNAHAAKDRAERLPGTPAKEKKHDGI